MTNLQLHFPAQRTAFEPGESIPLTVEWTLNPGETAVEMRLVWQTSGKGGTDGEVANTWRFDNPALRESRVVEIELPNSPYSFSGKLVSLRWAFELISQPSEESTRIDLTIAPGRREVILHAVQTNKV